MSTIDDLVVKVSELNMKVARLEQEVKDLKELLEIYIKRENNTAMLIKYVITPMLFILGALVGIKLAIP